MRTLKLILFACCVVPRVVPFTKQDVEVVATTLNFLNVGKCLLVSDMANKSLGITATKLMTKNMISMSLIDPQRLRLFMNIPHIPDNKMAIAIKVTSLAKVKDILIENFDGLVWLTWLLITDQEFDDEIRIPFNCQFLILKRVKGGRYDITENYHLKKSSRFVNDFGVWVPERGLSATSLSFYGRRRDMKGVQLVRAETENNIKCNTFELEREFILIWSDLSRIFNFTLKAVNAYSESEAEENIPDGSSCLWGILGNENSRTWVFSNSMVHVRMLTKFRSTNEVGWRAYITPFTYDLWTAVGLWLLISTIAVFVVEGCTEKAFYVNIFTSFFCLCGSDPLATHPANEPILFPTNLIYLMMLTVPTVIVPAYSAYILATLSVILPLEPFNDIKSFIANGRYKLTTISKTFILRYLQASKDPDIRYIYEHMFVPPTHKPTNSMMDYILNLFNSLCEDSQLAGLFIDSECYRRLFPCNMYVVQREVISVSMGFALRKNSPLQKLFNEMICQYQEKAIMYREYVNPEIQFHFEKKTEELNSLNISQTSAIFLLMPLGVLLALIVLFLEIATHKKNAAQKKLLHLYKNSVKTKFTADNNKPYQGSRSQCAK